MKSHIERCKVLKNTIGEEENFLSKITKLFKKLNDYIQKGLDTSYVKHIRKDLNVEGKLTFPRFFIPRVHKACYISVKEYREIREKEISKLSDFINNRNLS